MASAPLFPPPASRLNDDTLYHIFFLNTVRAFCISDEFPDDEESDKMPLTVTRRSSQVCKQWRRVLLRASFIWGRCIDLDALGTSTEWRDEVMSRAGNALLSIWGYFDGEYYVGDQYLAQLLAATWPRVRDLDIPYHGPHLELILAQLQLPAPSMESFLLHETTVDRDANITLFQGYAPKLVYIRIPPSYITYDAVAMWKSPTFFTVNMRHIRLDNESDIPPSVLLSACMRMPLLETLYVSIWQEDDPPPEFPPDQQVVADLKYLTSIYIRCPTFDVYQTFLSRISTAPGCSLALTHWVTSRLDKFVRYTDIMKQMFARFSESLYDNYPRTADSNDARLEILFSGSVFSAYDKNIWIQIGQDGGSDDDGSDVDPLYIPAAIDAFLAVKMPSDHINLTLRFSPDKDQRQWINSLPREIRTQLETSMQRLLGPDSMPWATLLQVTPRGLFLIHKMYQANTVFPRLQHLVVRGLGRIHMNSVILPFIAHRRETMMTVNIESLSESPARYVRAFGRDRLPENLVFIWNESERFSLADTDPDDENVESESVRISSSASNDSDSDFAHFEYVDDDTDDDAN